MGSLLNIMVILLSMRLKSAYHPFLQRMKSSDPLVSEEQPVIALLAGSRKHEIEYYPAGDVKDDQVIFPITGLYLQELRIYPMNSTKESLVMPLYILVKERLMRFCILHRQDLLHQVQPPWRQLFLVCRRLYAIRRISSLH